MARGFPGFYAGATQPRKAGRLATPVHAMDKATRLQTLFDRIHLLDARLEILRRDAAIRRLEQLMDRPEDWQAIDAEYQARLAELAADQSFLARCNVGGETMASSDQDRTSRLSAYRWRDHQGREQPFLTPDEEACLRIPRSTLTAADRPYKPPIPLSECLRIMDRMAAEGHIDPGIYAVFLDKDIPRT